MLEVDLKLWELFGRINSLVMSHDLYGIESAEQTLNQIRSEIIDFKKEHYNITGDLHGKN